MIEKLISGGQTGVDRAALDVARELKILCGGWCPRGRLAEDGPLDAIYPLAETPLSDHAQRTEWNVRDSDGTLVLHAGQLAGGTAFTVELAHQYSRPCLMLDLTREPDPQTVQQWIIHHKIRVLNVAGPRESGCPAIYERASQFLRKVFS